MVSIRLAYSSIALALTALTMAAQSTTPASFLNETKETPTVVPKVVAPPPAQLTAEMRGDILMARR